MNNANIISFSINHNKLVPGIYLHEILNFSKEKNICIFDIRFKKPNTTFLSNIEVHSLEHIIATFYNKYYRSKKIYFGPMGCLTGFYLILSGNVSTEWVAKTFISLNKYIHNLKHVPGKDKKSCGNYKMLNLKAALKAWDDFYKTKKNWKFVYPK